MTKTLKGHYMGHYERGIKDLLTTHADPADVVMKEGYFSAILNPLTSDRAMDNIIYRLESVYHTVR